MQNPKAVNFLLRISIASVFIYAAVFSTLRPEDWIGYIPQAARNIFPAQFLLKGFSLYQIILSLWILSGKKTFYAATLASVTLIGIIIANFTLLDILLGILPYFLPLLLLLWQHIKNDNNSTIYKAV